MEDFKELYEKAQEELAEAKIEATKLADKAEAWVKFNAKSLMLYAGLFVLGFAFGAALV